MSKRKKIFARILLVILFYKIILPIYVYQQMSSKKENFNYYNETIKNNINKSGILFSTCLLQKYNYIIFSTLIVKANSTIPSFIFFDSNRLIEEIYYIWISSTTKNNKRYYIVNAQLKKKIQRKCFFQITKNSFNSSNFNIFTARAETTNSIFKTHSPPSIA